MHPSSFEGLLALVVALRLVLDVLGLSLLVQICGAFSHFCKAPYLSSTTTSLGGCPFLKAQLSWLFPSSCKVTIPDRHNISWRNVNFQQHYKVCINKKSLQFLWHSMHREDYRNIKVWGGRFFLWHDEQGLDHSLVLILHYLRKHHCCLLSCCNSGTQISKRNNSRSLV